MARPNGKSVRLSDEALAIVNSAPGEGFNDKFERLIIAYSNTIPQRLAQLDAIEKQIVTKKKQLESLTKMEQSIKYMAMQLTTIGDLIPVVEKTLHSVSQEARQASTGLKQNEIQPFEQLSVYDQIALINEKVTKEDFPNYEGDVHEEDFDGEFDDFV